MYKGNEHQWWGPTTYAQHGDDQFILNLCHSMDIYRPSYLDLGAQHPIELSQTALMYERGSRGVNVDAHPHFLEEFQKYRPEDTNVHVGVAVEEGSKQFFMGSPGKAEGINSFCEKEMRAYGVEPRAMFYVSCMTINQIVEKYCPGKVFPDVLFTDIEWLDVPVLKSANWSVSRPKVICTEVHRGNDDGLIEDLDQKGFHLLCRLAVNLIFVDKNYYHYLLR